MGVPLRVLMVEDRDDDAVLLLRELRKGGFDVEHRRVETAEDMRAALRDEWDLVLSDFSMPTFSALGALEVLKESGRNLPFIIASGTIGEEAAISALKAGAHDFVFKGHLARFVPAITRELRDAALRGERRKIEVALAHSESRYRRIVEAVQEGIWMFDSQGKTTFVNRRLAEILKASIEQLIGTRFADFVPDGSVTLPAPSAGSPLRHDAVQLTRLDGARLWASVSSTPILDDDEQHLGTLVTVVDVTEQRQLTEQLLVSDRMASVGTLAAGVAHEINNPLAVILSNIEIAAQDLATLSPANPPDPAIVEELGRELRDVREAAVRVRDIVRDLKTVSRGDEQQPGPVVIGQVIESALRLARNELRHKARVVVELPRLPPVEAVDSRLGQVFVNLLVNAAQAIEEGNAEANEISVRGWTEGHRVVVEVRDTGAGMSAESLRRLFTPFFTTKTVGVGTGLGLAICQRIIVSLGGTISATSELGKGSTFRVELPISGGEPSAPATESTPLRYEPTARGRVLVVDDEETVGAALSRVLSPSHEVHVSQRARAMLERIRGGERYDVILCDLMMPEMTGAQFHAALLEAVPDQAARFVFLTGGLITDELRAFLGRVGNPIIEKPFERSRLCAVVDSVLKAHPPTGAPC